MYALVYQTRGRVKILSRRAGDTPEEAEEARRALLGAGVPIWIVPTQLIGSGRIGDYADAIEPEHYIMPRATDAVRAPEMWGG